MKASIRQVFTRGLTLVWAAVTLAGCYAKGIELREILSNERCQAIEPGAHWINLETLPKLRGIVLKDTTNPAEQTDALPMFVISKGPQPTPGYSLTFERAWLEDENLLVNILWNTPGVGSEEPPIETNPCLVLGIDTQMLLQEVIIQINDAEFARLTPS